MKYLLIGLSLILTGCVNTLQDEISPNHTLSQGEGFLFASVQCHSNPRMGLKINRSGNPVGVNMPDGSTILPVGNFEHVATIACSDDNISLVALPAGQYYFGSMVEVGFLGAGHNIGEQRSPKFNIVAGKVNYIGRFQLGFHRPAPGEPLGNEFALRKFNNYDNDSIIFSGKYPQIVRRYPTIVNLAR